MIKMQATSGILYIRAAIKPFADVIRETGDIVGFFHQNWDFQELLVPYFRRNRPFWRKVPSTYETNSGSLGKIVKSLDYSIQSNHPTHSFVGIGNKVDSVLKLHDYTKSCFYPIKELSEKYDFSMLLIGCVEESPGFSTVHATQYDLGLTQKHIIRYVLRWDYEKEGIRHSMVAKESPGCSISFDKFYKFYQKDNNFISGECFNTSYIFIPSARKAMETEKIILSKNPRFVECGRISCPTCRLRLY